MKLTITPTENGRGYRVVKVFAVISKSAKLGIPRRYQKTWNVRTVAPNFVSEECKTMFEKEASRWEARIMDKIRKARELKDHIEKQKEILI